SRSRVSLRHSDRSPARGARRIAARQNLRPLPVDVARLVDRFEDPDVLHGTGISRSSAATSLARLPAFRRRILRWTAWRSACRILPDEAISTSLVENGRRLRARDCYRQLLRTAGLFRGGL